MKYINNKDLLYSTGNYTQNLIIIYNGKESGKKIHMYAYIYICVLVCMYIFMHVYMYI